MRRRRDPLGIDLAQLLGVLQHGRELAREQVALLNGQREARQMRDALDFVGRQRERHPAMLARWETNIGARDWGLGARRRGRHGARAAPSDWLPLAATGFAEPRATEPREDHFHTSRRPAAVAGTWYPGTAGALTRDVDGYLQQAPEWTGGAIQAVLAPHAGLMFSGPVGAHAYRAAASQQFDVIVIAGPSHFVGFDGVSIFPEGAFATPLGDAIIDDVAAQALASSPVVRPLPSAHQREHSVEIQLPFVRRLFPDAKIVPLVMGHQTPETIRRARRRARCRMPRDGKPCWSGARTCPTTSMRSTAERLDHRVQSHVAAFDPEGLLALFEEYPEHERGRYVACGGGPAIAVMMAARQLGATDAQVLKYAHSGEVSGDYTGVVGYLAAAFGTFGARRLE